MRRKGSRWLGFPSPPQSRSDFVIVDMPGARLGDLLMLLPCLRAEDVVYHDANTADLTLPACQMKGSPNGKYAIHQGHLQLHSGHTTERWSKILGRRPQSHQLTQYSSRPRAGVVLAPTVESPTRQWDGWSALRAKLPHATVIAADLPRREFIDMLLGAEVVVCPNTSTAHLADALGVPKVVGLYSQALFQTCAPYWNPQHCIVAPSVTNISVGQVYESVARS